MRVWAKVATARRRREIPRMTDLTDLAVTLSSQVASYRVANERKTKAGKDLRVIDGIV